MHLQVAATYMEETKEGKEMKRREERKCETLREKIYGPGKTCSNTMQHDLREIMNQPTNYIVPFI